MKNSDRSYLITKRPADEGRVAPIRKDINDCSLGSSARGFVSNRSQRIFEIDFDYRIKKLARGGNEWTH